MTDNHTVNASKTADVGHKAAPIVQNDAKGNSHTVNNNAGMKSQPVSVHEKTDAHKGVSADPKFKDHNMHKDAEMKVEHVSHEKTGVQKDVCADPKCSCHDTHKDATMKSSQVSVHEKTDAYKGVSADPKFKDQNMHKDAEMNVSQEKTGTHKNVSANATPDSSNMKEIHAQIAGALAGAKFPVKTPADLISAFPNGASTKCHAGNITMTAGEAGKLLKATDFPFASAKAVADVIVQRASQ